MVEQIFLLSQVKRSVIISNKLAYTLLFYKKPVRSDPMLAVCKDFVFFRIHSS